jgi:hypothetical protein
MDHASAAGAGAGGLLIAMVVFLLVTTGLWLWSLIHCIQNKRISDSNRTLGIILIVVLGLLGSIIYLCLPEGGSRSRYGRGTRSMRGRGQTAQRGTRSFGTGRTVARSRR